MAHKKEYKSQNSVYLRKRCWALLSKNKLFRVWIPFSYHTSNSTQFRNKREFWSHTKRTWPKCHKNKFRPQWFLLTYMENPKYKYNYIYKSLGKLHCTHGPGRWADIAGIRPGGPQQHLCGPRPTQWQPGEEPRIPAPAAWSQPKDLSETISKHFHKSILTKSSV